MSLEPWAQRQSPFSPAGTERGTQPRSQHRSSAPKVHVNTRPVRCRVAGSRKHRGHCADAPMSHATRRVVVELVRVPRPASTPMSRKHKCDSLRDGPAFVRQAASRGGNSGEFRYRSHTGLTRFWPANRPTGEVVKQPLIRFVMLTTARSLLTPAARYEWDDRQACAIHAPGRFQGACKSSTKGLRE